MFNDLIHLAFVLSDGEVAISTENATGDNPNTSGLQLSDLMRRVMTSDNKLRTVTAL